MYHDIVLLFFLVVQQLLIVMPPIVTMLRIHTIINIAPTILIPIIQPSETV